VKARALAFGSRATGGDAGLQDIKGTFDRAKRVHDKTKAMHDTAKEAQAQVNEVKAAKNELRGAALDLQSEGRKGLAGGGKRGAAEEITTVKTDRAVKNGEASSGGGNRDLPSQAAVGETLRDDLVFVTSLAPSKADDAEAAAAAPAAAALPFVPPRQYRDATPALAAPLRQGSSSAPAETAASATAVAMSNQPAASGFLSSGWTQLGGEGLRNHTVEDQVVWGRDAVRPPKYPFKDDGGFEDDLGNA